MRSDLVQLDDPGSGTASVSAPAAAPAAPLVLTVAEAGDYLQVTRRVVVALVASGGLVGRLRGPSCFVSRRRLREFMGEAVEFRPLNEPRALTVAEAAVFLRRSDDTVYAMVRDPLVELPHVDTPQGFRFSAEALLAWVERR